MKDYLISDFYVFKKMKIIYLLPIICLLLVLLSNFIAIRMNLAALGMSQMQDMIAEESDESLGDQMVSGFETGFKMGFEGAANPNPEPVEISIKDIFSGGALYDASTVDLFESQISGLTVLMMVAIFAAFFYSSQVKGAFGKNILKANSNRWISFTSKTIVVVIYVALFFIFNFIIALVSNATMCESFKLGITPEFFGYVGVQFLLAVAMCLITGMVAVIANTAVGMIFAIVTGAGLLNLLLMLVDLLVNKVLFKGAHFATSDYLITGNVAALRVSTEAGDMVRPIIVGLVYLLIGFAITGYINQRRDIH